MMVHLVLLGCTQRVAWRELPPPVVEVTEIAVAAEGRECRKIADELTGALSSRPGVRVTPDADVQLVVRNCVTKVSADVDIRVDYRGISDGIRDERRVDLSGRSTVEVVIRQPGGEVVVAETVYRTADGLWGSDRPDDGSRRAFTFQNQLFRDMGHAVAQRVAPVPETIRRRIYKDPESGSARSFHNLAVNAEKDGDLQGALDFAREAYVANPTPRRMAYIDTIESRIKERSYAMSEEETNKEQ